MGFLKKDVLIGFLVSIFATSCGLFLYLEYFSQYDFETTIQLLNKGDLYGQVIALSALPNLLVFTVYIRKKQDYRARGVLLATILTALITFVLKFF